MLNIVVIGAGQLGSRHLQGIKKAAIDLNVYALDPDINSQNNALKRWDEIESNGEKKISICSDLSSLPLYIDLAIIATNANVRSTVTQKLLSSRSVKYIVFEKFLFQSIDEYRIMNDLLNEKKVLAWVNCPRRMFLGYQTLKTLLKDSTNFHYIYINTMWGLACNSIHFIDHCVFLFDVKNFKIDYTMLDDTLIESKRPGFIDFTGELGVNLDKGRGRVTLIAKSNQIASRLVIYTDKYFVEIDEISGFIRITENKNNGISREFPLQIKFQSDLSNRIIEDLFLSKKCELTPFVESSNLHIPLLKVFLRKYNKINKIDSKICPIT